MPNCKNCGARISKFDADICPVCGTIKPLEGVSSETVEITSQIDLNNFKDGQKVVCRRQKLLLFFIAFGFTGLPFYYLKRKKFAVLWLIINLALLAASFSLIFFVIKLHIALAIILPILLVYIINSVIGLIYNYLPDLKDGEGEFVI